MSTRGPVAWAATVDESGRHQVDADICRLRASNVRRTRSGSLLAVVEFIDTDSDHRILEIADVALLDLADRERFVAHASRSVAGYKDEALIPDLLDGLKALAFKLWVADADSGSAQEVTREINAGELQQKTISRGVPNYEWLRLLGCDGYVARGESTLISAYHKVGKSTLVRAAIESWRDDRVLVLSEESLALWAGYLAKRPARAWNHVNLIYALGMGREAMIARIKAGGERVICIDTLRVLLGVESENDNAEVTRALTEVLAACGPRTLIALHADRKSGGEHGLGVAGAGAFVGIVDAVLQIKRDPSNKRNRRIIDGEARSHIIEPLAYEMRNGELVAVGDPIALSIGDVKDRCLAALTVEWATTREVQSIMGEPKPSLEQVRRALFDLALPVADGDYCAMPAVERDPPTSDTSVKGKTVKWRLAE